MIIHSIELHHVKGIEHLHLDNLNPTGVTVIHGPNEKGKSTILYALQQALTLKHGSTAAPAKNMTPKGTSEGSTIILDATIGTEKIHLEKTYNYKKKCLLKTSRGTLTGNQAEDALAQLLNNSVDNDLKDILFVEQGNLDNALQALGLPSLQRSLDTFTNDHHHTHHTDDHLIEAAAAEYKRYYTEKTAKTAGELKDATTTLTAAEDTCKQLREKAQALREHVENVARLTEQRDTATADIDTRKQHVAEAQLAAEQAQQVQQHYDATIATRAQAIADYTHTEQLHQRREELAKDLTRAQQAATDAAQTHQELADKVAQHRDKLDAAEKDIKDHEQHAQQARTQRRRVTAQRDLVQVFSDATAAKNLYDKAQRASNELDHAHKQRDTRPISAADVERIATIDVDLRTARSVLQATSTQVELVAENTQEITYGDDTIQLTAHTPLTRALTEPIAITIGEVRATITPGRSENQARDDVEKLQEKLHTALVDLGVENLDEARDKAEAAAVAQHNYERAHQALDALLGEETLDELKRRAEELDTRMLRLSQDIEDGQTFLSTLTPDTTEHTLAELSAQVHQSTTAEDTADQHLADARTNRDLLLNSPLLQQFAQAETLHQATKEAQNRAEDKLRTFDEEHDPEELAALAHTQQAAVAEAGRAVEQARAQLEQAQPEMAASIAEGAVAALERTLETVRQADMDINKHLSYIDAAQGIEEQLAHAEAHLTDARRRFEAVSRRAHAAKVLFETLVRCRDAARAAYAQPYTDLLDQLMTSVFGHPSATDLNDKLEVSGRRQDGEIVELTQLSGGAQEQLSILQRLAIVQLVGEDEGVPLIIDDPLGNTDSLRLRAMSALIAQAAKKHQVIILTCAPERFDYVAGADVRSMSQLLGAAA
ncbi:AAA family ATPase [Corynebacterium aquilae]|uniref:Endonuclease GajA/Old nuclease/RecF-like AAA domain-containing protein n=1 Tax=Corynebacterium aquilae DSM 44791 TaxID=1431546 RepID=A0A1L7CFA4_9CORY|nr:AAA family ATPase [Corynebacterium aquilae]APT84529.1 hypothetical protein CAQU_05065 [Corynebacterium aquilae DSM 44791]